MQRLKLTVFIVFLAFIGVSCTYAPDIYVPVDTSQVPYFKFQRDYADALTHARAAWPCTDSELRSPMRGVAAMARLHYQAQKIYIIDYLTKKGYSVLKYGDLVPF